VRLDERLKSAIAAYKAGDLATGDRATAAAERLAKDIDALAGNQQETLGSWLADAAAYGDTPAEKAAFVEQAKAVVTVWGGTGHLSDYASRAWQGLYAGYYWPRWQRFLAAQRAAAAAHQPFDAKATAAAIRDWQAAWLKDGKMWARQRPAAPLALARTLLAESDAR
jgi:Alpha-N-acetylglucosaminidase (NAGLU).